MSAIRPESLVPSLGRDELSVFFRTHLPTVHGYLMHLSAGDRALAEDLTQDAWLALAEELARGRADRADIRWLLTVARTRFIDHVRHQQRAERKLALLADAGDTAELEAWDRPPEPSELIPALGRCDVMHRVVLVMRYIDDLPVPEIAAAIGRNVTATNSLLARARAQLRNIVQEDRRG